MTSASDFLQDLDRRTKDIAERCTGCGKCAAVCPTPGIVGIDDVSHEDVTSGVIDILRGDAYASKSEMWARSCCGTAACLDVCPEGINPRFMLTMARRVLNEARPMDESKSEGREAFQAMSKGVRMMSRLQMPPDVLSRLNPPANRSKPEETPDIVFYTGCNMLRTPHIGLICLDIFDRIDVTYEVYGGPANCCGILQFRPGDTENSGRQISTTAERFQATGASEVIAWCPTCHIQFSEVALPSMPKAEFEIDMLPKFLAARLDMLRPLMSETVKKRVALFEFPGSVGVTEAVHKLLNAVPGVETVDLDLDLAGYQMTSLASLGDYKSKALARLFRTAQAADVDVLCSVFHADHREIASHASEWPFDIANYMDIIAESMGINHPDLFQRLRIMKDVDRIVAEMTETVTANRIDLDVMRDAVVAFMMNDQHLSTDPADHPKTD